MAFRERIIACSNRKNSRIVLALDVTGPLDRRVWNSIEFVRLLHESIAAVKINHHLILPFGLNGLKDLIEECKKHDLPIIADIKLSDIGSTNEEVMQILTSYNIDCVIVNPFVGYEEGLECFYRNERKLGTLLLVYMSNAGSRAFYSGRFNKVRFYEIFARMAREWGADGIVVSSLDLGAIRESRRIVGNRMLIFSPGVGAQGGDALGAIRAGSDFLIVGRQVIGSREPRMEVERLNRYINSL